MRLIAPDIKWCEELKEGFYIINPDRGECGETAKLSVKDSAGKETDSGSTCFFRGKCPPSQICEFYKDEEDKPVKEPKCLEPVEFCDTASKSYGCGRKAPISKALEGDDGWACVWHSGTEGGACAFLDLKKCAFTSCHEYLSLPFKYFKRDEEKPGHKELRETRVNISSRSLAKKLCDNDPCQKGCHAQESGGIGGSAATLSCLQDF